MQTCGCEQPSGLGTKNASHVLAKLLVGRRKGAHTGLLGSRVLVRLAEGPLDSSEQRGGDALYAYFRTAVAWPELLLPGQTFSVEVHIRSVKLHT